MFSSVDDKQGIVRTSWKDVRDRFSVVDSRLTELIDKISPDDRFPIYLLYFPYGSLKGDTNNSYLPLANGNMAKLSDPNIEKSIVKDLGYGMHSSPLGIILEKSIEYFIEFDGQAFPYLISGPGTIFNRNILLDNVSHRNYTPNGILKASSGSRTAFMLPSINSHNGINRLSKLLDQELTTPRKLHDHFSLFRAISFQDNNWFSCLAYFSENWIHHIRKDHAWIEIKNYILEGKNNRDSFKANSTFFDIFCSKAQKDRNIRTSSPYLTNTATHLIKIALGEYPGYIPAINDHVVPIKEIQSIMSEAFALKKTPTLMVPYSLAYEHDSHPVYYSLQHPTTPHFLAKKNENVTANQEIDVINDILSKIIEEMSKPESLLAGTVFADLSKNIEFNYFHNYPPEKNKLIHNSRVLSDLDSRFTYSASKNTKMLDFCSEGQFMRGCIQIKPKAIHQSE